MPSSRSNTINKVPPFLELSRDTLQSFDTSELDLENVLSVWTGLTKCSSFIKSGKRLENISWRIVNRNLINNRDELSSHHQTIPSGGSATGTDEDSRERNKLNDGDFLSLLSIVADQNLIPLARPQPIRKRSSNQKIIRNLSRNSNRSVESFEIQKSRPSFVPKKSSSSKSLKKLNQKRRSTADLTNLTISSSTGQQQQQGQEKNFKVEHDSDLFEQPNPKYAFGVYKEPLLSKSSSNLDDDYPADSQNFQAPPLTRSNTSTSIVRGFSPSHISVAQFGSNASSLDVISSNQTSGMKDKEKEKDISFQSQTTPPPSLFDQPKSKNPQPRNAASPKISLFTHQHHPPPLPPPHSRNESTSLERIKSPLSQDTTQEILKTKEPSTLFQHAQPSKQHHQQQIRPKSRTGTLFDHSALQDNTNSNTNNFNNNVKSSLFEQVGISPDHGRQQQPTPPPPVPPLPHHKKRNNILNSLGMTSLAAKQHQPPRKDKNNMFFIESSPSPTESSKLIDSQIRHNRHHNRQRSSSSEGTRDDSSSSKARSVISVDEKHHEKHNNTSLFPGASNPVPKEILFSSDDSLSAESDWSSVSDSEGSDDSDENDLTKEWKQATQKRDEPLPRPQIKRSLLSGLFLNEMNEPFTSSSNNVSQHHSTSGVTTSQHWKAPSTTTNNSHDNIGGRNNNNNTGAHDLSSSISSTSIVVKHRNRPQSIHRNNHNVFVGSSAVEEHHFNIHTNGYNPNNNVLEISTTEPHTVISTSNINVSGEVSEPMETTNDQLKLREKLTGTQQAAADATSSSFSQMISKSALNLTSYFAMTRKNSFSSIATDRTKTRYKHESNAPPTAATLLPTALSTHMFLPNAHQKRTKSRLTSVLESDSANCSSNEPSRKNSEVDNINGESKRREGDIKSDTAVNNESAERPQSPTKSPTVPIIAKKLSSNIEIEGLPTTEVDNSNLNISRKLSPKTTRRQMLATELSDSLRKSILWDRKHGLPNNHHHQHHHHNHRDKSNGDRQLKDVSTETTEVINEENEDKIELVKEDTGNPNQPKIIKSNIQNFNNDWETGEADFHTRGW